MSNRFKYLIKNVGILTVSNFASKIMVFLLVPLYTSILSTSEYGVYDLVFSTVQLLFPVLTLNIVDAVMRFTMDNAKYSVNEIATIGIRYIIISFFPVGIFLFVCSKNNILVEIQGFELLILLYFIFYVLNQFFIQFAKGLERIGDMGIAAVIGTVSLIGGNVLLLLVFEAGLKGFFIANILSQAFSVVYILIRIKFLNYINYNKINSRLKKEMLCYCLPLITTTLSWWVNNAADKYIVAFLCGTAANGILSVAYKIPSILNTIQQIFIQAWQISAIKEYGGKKTAEFYGEIFRYLNCTMCFFCSLLIIFSKTLATFLYVNDFYVAWQYVPFLLISSVLNSASGLLGPILLAAKDSKSMAKSAIYGALVNIILNVVFVKFFGIQGATVATMISSFIIYYIRKKCVGRLICVKNYWIILFNWMMLCLQAVIEILSISYFLELGIMALILGSNFKLFLEIAKKLKDNRLKT